MKKYLILILSCAISILFIPLAMISGRDISARQYSNNTTTSTQTDLNATETTTEAQEYISVFRTLSNKTVDISLHEYVCGSVAAEMPLAYHKEAIKAQAVACYTNALRLKNETTSESESNISDNTAVHQGYIDEEQRKEKWGNDFDKYEKKLQNAVSEVENKAIYYNDTLCVAAFYAISNGKTEDAKYLWGSSVPYLKSVDSNGDTLSPGYASTVSYEKEDFFKILKKENITPDGQSLKNTIKISEKSPSDTVLECELYGKKYTGEEIRKMFSLRSPTFEIKTSKKSITFTVYGYGHGIGLSQYGSDYLAKQGYTYEEILEHYYTDVEIK